LIFEIYETVFEALYEVMLDNEKINMFTNLNDKEKETFVNVINERIKPEEVTFKEKFSLTSTGQNGSKEIKEAISNSLKPLNYDRFQIVYVAAGKFAITIKHDDIKSAQKLFDKFRENLIKEAKEKILKLDIKE
jgi:translation initiation factor 2 alpha subunit (eIF-2alpha)